MKIFKKIHKIATLTKNWNCYVRGQLHFSSKKNHSRIGRLYFFFLKKKKETVEDDFICNVVLRPDKIWRDPNL